MLESLLEHIKVVPEEQTNQNIKEATEMLGKIDPDDVIFLATALSLDNSIIWSDDKDFEKQNKVKVIKTKDLVNLFFP